MQREIFRKSALDRMASLDELDCAMTVVKPSSVIALISVAIIIVVALIWGFFGSVPDVVTGSGVLVDIDNVTSIKSTNQGAIKNVFVKSGDKVENGQIIARIERQDILDQIKVAERKLDGLVKMKEAIVSSSKKSNSQQNYMKQLYDQGLITSSEYLNSRQTEMNVDQQISEVKQQILVYLDNYQTATEVTANCTGVIREVPVKKGDYAQPGTTIAVIEAENTSNVYEALVYFPAADGKKITTGMTIGVIPTTVKQEEYGYIQGLITEVSDFPVSDSYLISSLQNQMLAQTFAKMGPLIEAKVSLIPDPSTYSGYKWSSSNGPSEKIGAGFMCSAKVTTSSKKPIELVIPTLKRKLLGIGETTQVQNGQ